MTKEEAIKELQEDKALYETEICRANDGTPDGRLIKALDMAIEALQTAEINCVHCERYSETEDNTGVHGNCSKKPNGSTAKHSSDVISRQVLLEKLQFVITHGARGTYGDHPISAEVVKDFVQRMPSAEKTGKWINKENSVLGITYECSNCGRDCVSAKSYDLKGNEWSYNFCPNCGVRMVGDTE